MIKHTPVYIIGISAWYHDSAATLLKDGTILAAAHEERFSRKKHDSSFPALALKYALEEAGISLADVNTVVFYDKPFIKFERLLENLSRFCSVGSQKFSHSDACVDKRKTLHAKHARKSPLAVPAINSPKKIMATAHPFY